MGTAVVNILSYFSRAHTMNMVDTFHNRFDLANPDEAVPVAQDRSKVAMNVVQTATILRVQPQLAHVLTIDEYP